ncbi:pumilio-like protein isoform A [Chlorella sorokiniana]|uniref:Pumilio-like protein isoform A n=1 Tax=Chlorella sorokiniana TaxID=3076 RepID=A0A2P6TCF7_CHLSO|nr:pumilio-like protein isoform A [Chlorella sorokiniana]|eukprot:PRW20331.1 pumilio-like protein isoform A [Chlorella sorokiniana]
MQAEGRLKMPPGPTVNLLATAGSGHVAAAYSPASSPFAHGSTSSSRSSPAFISRTGSGVSEDVSAGGPDLTAATLQALGRQASLAAAAAAASGSPTSGASGSPHGASTPHPAPGRSNLGPAVAGVRQAAELEASMQGLTINTGTRAQGFPAATGAVPTPVEVFARFPQDQTAGPSGRAAGGLAAAGYGSAPDGYLPPGAFYVGSPPGAYGSPPGYGMPPGMFAPGPPHGPAYYPQPMGPQQHPPGYVMHPYYGMVPASHPAAAGAYSGPMPHGAYGMYPPHPAGGPAGGKGGYGEAADYARQYQAMMSYMQGFGMMVSPSGSPERMSRPLSQPNFRRNGGSSIGSQASRDESRGRVGGRPSRLSLDMSASKSENGDAHRLDPELVPFVSEDKADLHSELLEEFRASSEGRQWALEDLKGHLYPFCRDQHGSRLVQQQLESADPALVAELFGEVQHKLLPLMVDVFGNYVVQRFLERGGPEVQAAVGAAIRGKALPLSLQVYGCRVVQKALEVLPQGERVAVCGELTEHTLRCVRDQNGNHVVQKCIECVQPSDPARTMIETIVNKGQTLSTHTFGCRLVQRVLEFCSIEELKERVIADVLGTTLQLSHDQYGNYVVQHLVTKGPEPARDAIVAKVAPQVMTLAQHKYASNVVEACLKHGRQAHRDAIVDTMVREAAVRPTCLVTLMRDQFGNYVVQRALDVATPAQRAALLATIQPHLEALRKYTYGKHIVNKVEALLAAQVQAQAEAGAPAAAAEPAAALLLPVVVAAEQAAGAVLTRARPLYGLAQPEMEAAVVAASERHGPVTKAGPVPSQFWTDERRPWRERVFLEMLKRDAVQPRSSDYWAADPATGELALRPLALPYPLCHTYVNHKYKVIFIIHPKSASTAIKRYMQLCRIQQTESCLSPLDDAAQLEPLGDKWHEYFVFTFVRNPWVRAFSSWKFLRQGYMLPPGGIKMAAEDAPLASGKDAAHFGPEDQEPCAEAGWADFCGDPLMLGRLCLVQPHCCPGREGQHFMHYHMTDQPGLTACHAANGSESYAAHSFYCRREGQHFMHYHMTDQATCLLTADGQLAVDFIGRVENVDEDMREAIKIINSRLPPGVEPLQLGDEVAARNVGPAGEAAGPPENARYLPAFQGAANSTCFRKLARFYAKDVKLMYPQLYSEWGGEEAAGAAAAAAAAGGHQAWRRSRLRLD